MRRITIALVLAVLLAGVSIARASMPAAAATPVQVVIRLDPYGPLTIDALNAAHATTTVDSIGGLPGVYLIAAADGRTIDQLILELEPLPGVEFVEPVTPIEAPEVGGNGTFRAWGESTAAAAQTQYAQSLLRLGQAQTLSTGSGRVVAVLDTGVTANSSLLTGALLGGFDAIGGGTDTTDPSGHGTHVAGIIRQVAPSAQIMPIRVLGADGLGTTWSLASGMVWALDHGAHVLNMSLGGRGSHGVVKAALDLARLRRVTVVAAAGNDGREHKQFPAADDCVLAVTSSGPTDAISSFSTRGSWVAVSAPGERISSTHPYLASGFAEMSGTSMSSAFVAGQAASMLALRPSMSPGQVQLVIRGSAAVLRNEPRRSGVGRIDVVGSLVATRDGIRYDPRSLAMNQECLR